MSGFESKDVDCAPHRWRVLEGGTGAPILLLHGAGASADSFRELGARLAEQFHIIAPDLPGHGETRLGRRHRSGLPEMAADIAALCRHLGAPPEAIIGHSAGGAISIALREHLSPRGQILINPALAGFSGAAGFLFPLLARALTVTPFAASLLSRNVSDPDQLGRLLERTGSEISQEIFARYRALAANPRHIDGTLRMMAAWDLSTLSIAALGEETTVLLGLGDGTVRPADTRRLLAKSPCTLVEVEGGHLLHEEKPDHVTEIMLAALEKLGVPAGTL